MTGEHLEVFVSFSRDVTVDTRMGIPQIALDVNGQTRYAAYVSGGGSSVLTFRYIVTANDEDLDGVIVPASLTLNSGTIETVLEGMSLSL